MINPFHGPHIQHFAFGTFAKLAGIHHRNDLSGMLGQKPDDPYLRQAEVREPVFIVDCVDGEKGHVRSNDLFGSQFQCKLPFKTQLSSEIAATAFRAFCEHYRWGTKVRAVTVRAIELVPQKTPDQLSLFVDHERLRKREHLEDAVESIRSRFGKRAVTYALLLGDLKMPNDGRHSVKMPGMMYQ